MTETTKTLDEELQAWLTEHAATLDIVAIGPSKGVVSVDNFATADGLKLPARWALGVTVVKAKQNGANSTI